MKPFLKWAGGKTSALPQYRKLYPPKIEGNFFEPFLGSGAVFFDIYKKVAKKCFLSDINHDLIKTFLTVRQNSIAVIIELQKMENLHSKEFFHKIRGEYNTEKTKGVDHAAAFIYLNKTCFNGLYRVNQSGEFNVSWGKRRKFIAAEEIIALCAIALKRNSEIFWGTFEMAVNRTEKGDFVYMDPPYIPVSKTANFDSYTADGFAEHDHLGLAMAARELDKKGVKFIITNSDTEMARYMYKGFDIVEIKTRRNISAKNEGRGTVSDLIIKNY